MFFFNLPQEILEIFFSPSNPSFSRFTDNTALDDDNDDHTNDNNNIQNNKITDVTNITNP
jgi:hypothetical protein